MLVVAVGFAVVAGGARGADATTVDAAAVRHERGTDSARELVPRLFDRLEQVLRAYLAEDARVERLHFHTPATFALALPVLARQSAHFGRRRDPFTRKRRMHKGIDLAAPRGTPVISAAEGVVIRAGRSGGYGRMVIVDHGNGLTTRYAHLRRIHVKRGDVVDTSTIIGAVGSTGRSTGPHLHFEVRQDGRAIDPVAFFRAPSRLLLVALR